MDQPRWKHRFLAPTISMPSWARDEPDRCVYVSNASGVSELYTWDRRTDEHKQATKRPSGTTGGSLTPDGDALWWFDDTKGDEKGGWRTQSFGDGPGEAAVATSLDPGYPTGLALASSGRAAIGLAAEGRHRIFAVAPGMQPRTLHDHHEASGVGGWSRDESLLVISHAEHGDNRNRALRVVTSDGDRVADLWDGEGLGVTSFSWSDVVGDQRLLIAHERRGRRHPALWHPLSGDVVDLDVSLGEEELVSVDWYPCAAAVLVWTIGRGRGHLFRHDLETGVTEPLPTTPGTIVGARVRPDGEVWWAGSTSATPASVRCGSEVLRPPGDVAPEGVPYEDVLVDAPGGQVHGFVARPAEGDGPFPTVFRIHGGPAGADMDSFMPAVQAWVDHGFAVVMVNYRGSTGYGKAWSDAIVGKPGYRELEDIAAVRDHVISAGIADPSRIVLHGGSWGGYLTLLGIGTQPDLWSLGVAAVPLASLRDHYSQQGEVLQALWRSLFGGTPETLGDELDEIDPIASVRRIRVPVFILVGDNDPRCPLPQVLTYVEALAATGVEHELYRFDAGHASMVVEEQLDQLSRYIGFVARHLGTTPPILA